MTLSLSHTLFCRSCGPFGHRARKRAREADERLLVAFHRDLAAQVRAERAGDGFTPTHVGVDVPYQHPMRGPR